MIYFIILYQCNIRLHVVIHILTNYSLMSQQLIKQTPKTLLSKKTLFKNNSQRPNVKNYTRFSQTKTLPVPLLRKQPNNRSHFNIFVMFRN